MDQTDYESLKSILHTSSPNLESHPNKMNITSSEHLKEAREGDKS